MREGETEVGMDGGRAVGVREREGRKVGGGREWEGRKVGGGRE